VELLPVAAAGLLLLALVAMVVVWALWTRSRGAATRLIANAKKEAERIEVRGEIEGQRIQKDAEILARERLLAARTEFERETRDLRVELSGLAHELDEKKTELDQQGEELIDRDRAVAALETEIQEREGRLAATEQELENAIAEQRTRLEQIAGLTVEQAKNELLRSMENDARIDAANMVKRIEDESNEKAKEKARRVISMAIQRIASEHVVESTVSVVDLPSDEMKGRIIGREGRNIRAFEQATGVDLIVDDTPDNLRLLTQILAKMYTVRVDKEGPGPVLAGDIQLVAEEGVLGAVLAPDECAHPREQFLESEGLHQVVVGAQVEAPNPIRHLTAGGEVESRGVDALLAERLEDLEAVRVGEHDVDDQQIEGIAKGALDAALGVLGHLDGIAALRKPLANVLAGGRIVLDVKDPKQLWPSGCVRRRFSMLRVKPR